MCVCVCVSRLRQCCCHPALMVSDRLAGVDVEEGLEEALDSLALDHKTQVSIYSSHHLDYDQFCFCVVNH